MGRTPAYGFPYPDASTLITDSAAVVKELAEKIDTVVSWRMSAAGAAEITVPGVLLQTIKASGTYTLPSGGAPLFLVVIGGGGQGGGDEAKGSDGTSGGSGGGVRLWETTADGSVLTAVIGGSGTATTIGPITAPPGVRGGFQDRIGWSVNLDGVGRSGFGIVWCPAPGTPRTPGFDGWDGVSINGTRYSGGGGGSSFYSPRSNNGRTSFGGYGGGGDGGSFADGLEKAGTAGTGGGGGGGRAGAPGGSGVVLVFGPAALADAFPRDANDAPEIVAGLSPVGVLEGVYAANPDHPEVPGHAWTVHYPTEPQTTGRRIRVIIDQVEKVIDEKLWPGEGWQYADGVWVPPGGFPHPPLPRITAAYPLPDSTIQVEWGVDFDEDLVVDRTEVRVTPAKGDPTGYSVKGDPRAYTTGKWSPGTYQVDVRVRVEALGEWSEWSEAAPVTISTTEPAFIGGREWDGGGGYRWLIFDPADAGVPTTVWEVHRTKTGATVTAEVIAVGAGGAGMGQTIGWAKGGNGGGGEMVLGTLPPATAGSIMVTVAQGGKNADGKDPADTTVVEQGGATIRARAGKSTTTKADGAGFGPVEVPEAWQVAPPFRWNLPDSARVGGSREWDKSARPNGRFEGQGGGGTNSSGPQRGGDGHDGTVVLRWRVS